MLREEGKKRLILDLIQFMLLQARGGGVIVPNYQELVYMPKILVYVNELQ